MGNENSIKGKTVYSTMDIAKFIACICVIAIHTGPLADVNVVFRESMYTGLFLLAVPFFFVSSGFFLGKKLISGKNRPKEIFSGYIKRLLSPYIVFSIINIAQNVLLMIINGTGIKTVITDVIKSILFYPYGGLWFVWACIVGAVLLYPFVRKGKLSNLAILIGLALYAFSLVCSSYKFISDSTFLQPIVDGYLRVFLSYRNGVLTGFLFLGLGIKCAEFVEKHKINNKKLLFLFLSSYVLVWLEKGMLKYFFGYGNEASFVFSFIVAIPLLVMLVVNTQIKISKKTSTTLRNLSTGMYFLHRPIIFCVEIFVSSCFLCFLITTVISFIICIVVYKLKPKYIYNLLR